jgi:hypothetical protein
VFFTYLCFSCAVFFRYFCCFLACVFACLLFLCCLSVLCCYLLSISSSILNIGLLGSMALSFMCRLFLYNLCMWYFSSVFMCFSFLCVFLRYSWCLLWVRIYVLCLLCGLSILSLCKQRTTTQENKMSHVHISGKETKQITKLFKDTPIKIAYKTRNTIQKLTK